MPSLPIKIYSDIELNSELITLQKYTTVKNNHLIEFKGSLLINNDIDVERDLVVEQDMYVNNIGPLNQDDIIYMGSVDSQDGGLHVYGSLTTTGTLTAPSIACDVMFLNANREGETLKAQLLSITQRLDALGFSSADLPMTWGSILAGALKRQGNYVICSRGTGQFVLNSDFGGQYLTVGKTVFTLPKNYRPKENTDVRLVVCKWNSVGAGNMWSTIAYKAQIQTNGECKIVWVPAGNNELFNEYCVMYIDFGFEASPRE